MPKKPQSPKIVRLESTIKGLTEDYTRARSECCQLQMRVDKLCDSLVKISEQNRDLLKLYRELLDEKLKRDAKETKITQAAL